MKRSLLATAAIAAVTAVAQPAAAAKNNLLATHGAWEAYAYAEKAGKVCYIASSPQKSEGGAKGRNAFVTVTHRKADNSTDVVGVGGGEPYKAGSSVDMEIGAAKFKLFTSGDGAWAKDTAGDKAIVAAMRKGNAVVVRGTPAKGSAAVDTYSLTGFSAAYAEIAKACDVR